MLQGLGRMRAGGGRRAANQGPTPGVVHTADKRPAPTSTAARLAFAGGGGQGAQAGEAVSIHQAGAYQFLQGCLQLAAQQMGLVYQFIEKQRAMLAQGQVDLLRLGRQGGAVGRLGQPAPQRYLATGEQNHRGAAQRHGAGLVAQARPDQLAAAAQVIEPGR